MTEAGGTQHVLSSQLETEISQGTTEGEDDRMIQFYTENVIQRG